MVKYEEKLSERRYYFMDDMKNEQEMQPTVPAPSDTPAPQAEEAPPASVEQPPTSPSPEEKKKDESPAGAPDEKTRRIHNVFDFVEMLVLTLTAVILLTSFVCRHSVVDGGSMNNTLTDGEHLILYSLFYQPQAGDIVVFEDYTATGMKKPLVKRVIATEGQTVRLVSATEVYVDGVRLQEDYVFTDGGDYHYSYPMEFTVEPGRLFVLGDHRNNSHDSRAFGTVSTDSLLGKVVVRFGGGKR